MTKLIMRGTTLEVVTFRNNYLLRNEEVKMLCENIR